MSPPDSIPISALQHFLFCPRQCALIHLEQLWAENQFTAEGRVLHDKANTGPDEHRSSRSILRHLHVQSRAHEIHGICDVVERLPDGSFIPVEYKRGKPKSHRADEVQLCAQGLCLEEMFQRPVAEGHLFYGAERRRTVVPMDKGLRSLTNDIIAATLGLLEAGVTPTADFDKGRCSRCSLLDLCLPKKRDRRQSASAYLNSALTQAAFPDPDSSL